MQILNIILTHVNYINFNHNHRFINDLLMFESDQMLILIKCSLQTGTDLALNTKMNTKRRLNLNGNDT